MVNLAPFGLCRSLGYPATASATAAAHGHLTPMPCMHNTPAPWIGGKIDYLVKGQPALLQSCKCQCMWGGTISLINNGQVGEGAEGVNEKPVEVIEFEVDAISPISLSLDALDGFSHLNEALKHLIELKQANPKEALKGIPSSWKRAYNNAIKKINENGIDGFASSYSEIEHAHNIYKLATSETAKQYGYSKLSHMMPHQMFDIADKIPGFLETMPTKDFWNTFDTYVPLYTNAGDSAYFQPNGGYVNISMSDEDNIYRLTNSDWYKAGLIHHEFGHAYDQMKGWRNDPEFIAVFESFKEEIERSDIINGLLERQEQEIALSVNEEEQLGSLSDCLQAATEGHEFIPPRGHGVDYFADPELQMAEFIAHMSENYWSGNDLFESLAPETYQNMIDLLQRRWN